MRHATIARYPVLQLTCVIHPAEMRSAPGLEPDCHQSSSLDRPFTRIRMHPPAAGHQAQGGGPEGWTERAQPCHRRDRTAQQEGSCSRIPPVGGAEGCISFAGATAFSSPPSAASRGIHDDYSFSRRPCRLGKRRVQDPRHNNQPAANMRSRSLAGFRRPSAAALALVVLLLLPVCCPSTLLRGAMLLCSSSFGIRRSLRRWRRQKKKSGHQAGSGSSSSADDRPARHGDGALGFRRRVAAHMFWSAWSSVVGSGARRGGAAAGRLRDAPLPC